MWQNQNRLTQGYTCGSGRLSSTKRHAALRCHGKRLIPFSKALPPRLKRGMEKLTGVSLEDVQVHYNSPNPAMVQAHAYAQGKDIFLAPGQEHHLSHELGHIAQQALGMVQATTEVNGVPVNEDPKLEQQATEWGELAQELGNTR